MKTCLIVDDVEVSRYAASVCLEELGFHILEAEDEAGATKALKANKVDIVILDWHLRKKNSLELLAHIKETYKTVPVVMLSGVENESKAKEARERGAQAFLTKPTTTEKLKTTLSGLGLL